MDTCKGDNGCPVAYCRPRGKNAFPRVILKSVIFLKEGEKLPGCFVCLVSYLE